MFAAFANNQPNQPKEMSITMMNTEMATEMTPKMTPKMPADPPIAPSEHYVKLTLCVGLKGVGVKKLKVELKQMDSGDPDAVGLWIKNTEEGNVDAASAEMGWKSLEYKLSKDNTRELTMGAIKENIHNWRAAIMNADNQKAVKPLWLNERHEVKVAKARAAVYSLVHRVRVSCQRAKMEEEKQANAAVKEEKRPRAKAGKKEELADYNQDAEKKKCASSNSKLFKVVVDSINIAAVAFDNAAQVDQISMLVEAFEAAKAALAAKAGAEKGKRKRGRVDGASIATGARRFDDAAAKAGVEEVQEHREDAEHAAALIAKLPMEGGAEKETRTRGSVDGATAARKRVRFGDANSVEEVQDRREDAEHAAELIAKLPMEDVEDKEIQQLMLQIQVLPSDQLSPPWDSMTIDEHDNDERDANGDDDNDEGGVYLITPKCSPPTSPQNAPHAEALHAVVKRSVARRNTPPGGTASSLNAALGLGHEQVSGAEEDIGLGPLRPEPV